MTVKPHLQRRFDALDGLILALATLAGAMLFWESRRDAFLAALVPER